MAIDPDNVPVYQQSTGYEQSTTEKVLGWFGLSTIPGFHFFGLSQSDAANTPGLSEQDRQDILNSSPDPTKFLGTSLDEIARYVFIGLVLLVILVLAIVVLRFLELLPRKST